MKSLRMVVLSLLVVSVLGSISNINLSPTGNYARLSTKGGFYASVTILIYILFSELGYLPFKFKGKKKRSAIALSFLTEKSSSLKIVRSLDHSDCLLRYLCELEAYRIATKENNCILDPDMESDMFLLKIAKRDKDPALLMREDPGSFNLPFEIAVYTGMAGIESCINAFHLCPFNVTTLHAFLREEYTEAFVS